MTWALDEAAAEESKLALEARILDAMHPGQRVTFGWNDELKVARTLDGFEVNGQPMTREEALGHIGAAELYRGGTR